MSDPFDNIARAAREMFGTPPHTPNTTTVKDVLRKAYPKWATTGQIASRTKQPLKNVDEELQKLVLSGEVKRGRTKEGYVVYRLAEGWESA